MFASPTSRHGSTGIRKDPPPDVQRARTRAADFYNVISAHSYLICILSEESLIVPRYTRTLKKVFQSSQPPV
jgi:hypothetical protein